MVHLDSALTFTACYGSSKPSGEVILPGIRLQLGALGSRTARLSSNIVLPEELPSRHRYYTSQYWTLGKAKYMTWSEIEVGYISFGALLASIMLRESQPLPYLIPSYMKDLECRNNYWYTLV